MGTKGLRKPILTKLQPKLETVALARTSLPRASFPLAVGLAAKLPEA